MGISLNIPDVSHFIDFSPSLSRIDFSIDSPLSSAKILSFNWGTASFVAIILLGISRAFLKDENVEKWRIPHRILGIISVAFLIAHLIIIF